MTYLENLKTGLFMEFTLIIGRSRHYLFNKLSVIEKLNIFLCLITYTFDYEYYMIGYLDIYYISSIIVFR